MKKDILSVLLGITVLASPLAGTEQPKVTTAQLVPIKQELLLTCFNLSIDDVAAMARSRIAVRVDQDAWERVALSHNLLLKAAKEGKAVYGLNRGVGLNKDKTLFEGDALTQEAREASINFNRNNLYATSSAAGPEMPAKIVFSVMLVKLNSILQGTTGAQPEVAKLLQEFINRGIQPVIPSRGSIGEADITILAHLGLTLMGEGKVYFEGKLMPTSTVLAMNGLKPLVPFGKDSLSIMSSNAYSAALGALLTYDAERLLDKSV